MDTDTAKLIVTVGILAGLIAWLFALRLYNRMRNWPATLEWQSRYPGLDPAAARQSLTEHLLTQPGQVEPGEKGVRHRLLGVDQRFALEKDGGRGAALRVQSDFSAQQRTGRRAMAVLVLVVEPLVIALVGWALMRFVVPSDVEAMRWQSLQVGQIVHVLWPPFLVYFILVRFRDQARRRVERIDLLLKNETRQ